MRNFSRLWNVNVVAGFGLQVNAFDANQGSYQIVHADGRERIASFLPADLKLSNGRRALRWLTGQTFA